MKLSTKKPLRILSVLLIHFIICGWTILYFKHLYLNEKLLSTTNASQYLSEITLQSILVKAPTIIVIILCAILLKQKVANYFSLKVEKKSTKIIVLLLLMIYILSLARQLIVYDDPATKCFSWIYYLVFIAFFEEFEYRALIPALLNGHVNKYTEWLLPNILFASAHLIMPIVQGTNMIDLVPTFLSSVLGYVLIGLFWEWCKRTSGSLWVGVLIHALMDFGY